jgi:hypothetical protein
MTRSRGIYVLIAAALSTQTAAAQLARRQARVDITTPKAPESVVVDGHRVLVYELHVTNLGRGPLGFREIDVFADGVPGDPLATFRDSALASMLQPGIVLNPFGRIVAYVWVALGPRQAAPTHLRHRLVFDILDTADARRDGGTQSAIDSIVVPVTRVAPLVLRAPLDSGEWLAGSSPSNTSDHRRSLNALNGHGYIAQRFAIDWVRIGPNGNTYHDDEHKNEDYWSFGQPVRSVAAGDVVAVLDSIPDNTPHAPLPAFTPRTLAGNFVTVRIGPDQYATYAHLAHGTMRVHVHQHVGRGEVVGLLGNSGQATGPHLHFQITDGPSVLASEGIPYVLDRYTFLGYASDFEPDKHPSIPRRAELPGNDAVVRLP